PNSLRDPTQTLEVERGAQVYTATTNRSISRTIDDAEGRAEDVQCGRWSAGRIIIRLEGPSRVIQNVGQAGKKLEANPLHDSEGLCHRKVPLERILVTDKQQLPKLAGRRVREQERGIGPTIRAD